MRIFTGRNAVTRPPVRAVVTVGMFDGVHVAHQRVIRRTVLEARRRWSTSVLITFDPDPHTVLHPSRAHPSLMPLSARLEEFRRLGVHWVWVIPFTPRFARMRATEFITHVLVRRLHAVTLIVGDGFVFGRNRQGDMEMLRGVGAALGMRVIPVRTIRRAGMAVSSSHIRRLIAAGRLAKAGALLGRRPTLYGTVVRGVGRGRQLGFPTANIRLQSATLPPRGVYAVIVSGATRLWRGVMNLGVRPTFGPGALTCEVHVLSTVGPLLGRPLSVTLIARLRDERCFPSVAALRAQIQRDVRRARRLLTHLS